MIKLDKLSVSYGNKTVLNSLSYNIAAGELVLVTGRNGVGKSTLLKTIADKGIPYSGSIEIMNSSSKKFFDHHRHQVGLSWDRSFIYKYLTGRENIEAVLEIKGFDKETYRERMDYLIERLSLTQYQNALGRDLSYGTRKKFYIAAQLVSNPLLYIGDEPFSGLDRKSKLSLLEILGELASKGSTCIVSSHEIVEDKTNYTKNIELGNAI